MISNQSPPYKGDVREDADWPVVGFCGLEKNRSMRNRHLFFRWLKQGSLLERNTASRFSSDVKTNALEDIQSTTCKVYAKYMQSGDEMAHLPPGNELTPGHSLWNQEPK